MNVLILGNMSDKQSGIYILQACGVLDKKTTAIDTRRVVMDVGRDNAQAIIFNELTQLKNTPDLIIVMKGLELTPESIIKIRKMYPKAIYVNWFFDRYFIGKNIWESTDHFDLFRTFDYFFCSLKGVATRLKRAGLKNAVHLPEACSPENHKEQYYNAFQEKKYGEDVAFIGNLGFFDIHPTRIKMLQKIVKEGFRIKIWGAIIGDPKHIPLELRQVHTSQQVINTAHSIVSQTSLVNIGLDHDLDIEQGYSARIYRVMCAGGLYLSNYIPEIEKIFKVNAKDAPITEDQELVVFYDEEDLVKKLDFLLEHNSIRKKIAENGKKVVLAKHTFKHRIKEMAKIIGVKK